MNDTKTGHVIEADFISELGSRVLVLTCMQTRSTCLADILGRCTRCGEKA